MTPHTQGQSTTFFEKLQSTTGLDLRDKRGKRHPIAVILAEFTCALLCNRDGFLSSIHRHMVNHHRRMMAELGMDQNRSVSRSQLPIALGKVSLPVFEQLVFEFYGVELNEAEKQWFAADGKELRGSIERGDKRGEVVVQAVRHIDGAIAGQAHYNGTKESEIPTARTMLEGSGLLGQKVSMDALHLNPETTAALHQAGGTYLIGLKGNQKELSEEMQVCAGRMAEQHSHRTWDKAHGRVDERFYKCYDVRGAYFDKRWERSGIATLVSIERTRVELKTAKQSTETSLYLSNQVAQEMEQARELFAGVRNHWSVEVTNHVRDVSLREDLLRTKKRGLPKWRQLLGH